MEIVRLGIYGVEAYTIFKVSDHSLLSSSSTLLFFYPCLGSRLLLALLTVSFSSQVGEILGRRHLIGYDLH